MPAIIPFLEAKVKQNMIKIRYFFKNIVNLDGSHTWIEDKTRYETFSDALRATAEYESRGCVVEVSW